MESSPDVAADAAPEAGAGFDADRGGSVVDLEQDEFRTPSPVPNPLADGEPGKVEDMIWFGLVPGLIINKLRQRKAERDHEEGPIGRLEELSFRQLAELEESLHDVLEAMTPPTNVDDDFVEGYECHVRLMRWLTQKGKRGDAIRHALDSRDGETLIHCLCGDDKARASEPDFFLGFQSANGELAERFEQMLPRN